MRLPIRDSQMDFNKPFDIGFTCVASFEQNIHVLGECYPRTSIYKSTFTVDERLPLRYTTQHINTFNLFVQRLLAPKLLP